ncbi:hypothetical protein FRC06_004107 [Ceratobasidium sp. 370]|nr:hypothetical protein FRC06_004107 [Ceratobasidium sp. 370]
MCPDCPGSEPIYWCSTQTKSRHYGKVHKDLDRPKHQSKRSLAEPLPVKVQSVFELDSHRKDFRVEPTLAPGGETSTARLEGNPEDQAFRGFLKFREAVLRVKVMPKDQGLKETWPFIHFLGWDKLVKGCEIQDLVKLAELPKRGDKLHGLVELCEQVFTAEQEVLESSAHPMILQQINDPRDGKEHTAFKSLQSNQSRQRYSHTWARLMALTVQMTQRHYQLRESPPSETLPFTAFITGEQSKAARQLVDSLKAKPGAVDPEEGLHKLSMACFAPKSSKHMGKGPFNDIVNVFVILSSLCQDSTFREPKLITPGLADIQYLMRMVVFQDIKQQCRGPQDDIIFVTAAMAHHLKCGEITPFGALQSLKHVIQHFAKMTMGLLHVHWTNETGDRVQLDGHVVKLDDVHEMIAGHLKETKEFLDQKVLMGLTLDEIGYGIAPDTPIIDDLSHTSPGYSFLTDPRNPFHEMTTLLAKAFLQHPKVKGRFCSGLDEHGAPVWIRSRVADWLRDLEELTEKLSLLMFLLGGQPPRGTEFCTLKLHNPTTRLRGMFWLDGSLLYVIAYSKVES